MRFKNEEGNKSWHSIKRERLLNGNLVIETGLKGTNTICNCLDLDAACERFLEYCEDEEKPFTLPRLCVFLNMSVDDFFKYATVEFNPMRKEKWSIGRYRKNLFQKMLNIINAVSEENGLKGRENVKMSLAVLKANFPERYMDKSELKVDAEMNVTSIAALLDEAKGITRKESDEEDDED